MAKRGVRETVEIAAGRPQKSVQVCDGEVAVGILHVNAVALGMAMSLLSDIAADLGLKLGETEAIEDRLLSKMTDISWLLKSISTYADKAYPLLVELTTIDSVESVRNLDAADLAAVVLAVVEVNKDFFAQKVTPVLQAAGVDLGQVAAKLAEKMSP